MSQDDDGKKAVEGKAKRRIKAGKERFSIERIGENIRRRMDLGRQVDQLACDEVAVLASGGGSEPRSRQQRRWLDRQMETLAGRELRLRQRDDAYVVEALRRRTPLEAVHVATGPTDVDELLHVIEADFKVLPLLAALSPPDTRVDPESGKTVQARFMYPPQVLALVSLLSRYMSVVGAPELMEVVLTDPRYMSLAAKGRVQSERR